jgi:hypothetical protein
MTFSAGGILASDATRAAGYGLLCGCTQLAKNVVSTFICKVQFGVRTVQFNGIESPEVWEQTTVRRYWPDESRKLGGEPRANYWQSLCLTVLAIGHAGQPLQKSDLLSWK